MHLRRRRPPRPPLRRPLPLAASRRRRGRFLTHLLQRIRELARHVLHLALQGGELAAQGGYLALQREDLLVLRALASDGALGSWCPRDDVIVAGCCHLDDWRQTSDARDARSSERLLQRRQGPRLPRLPRRRGRVDGSGYSGGRRAEGGKRGQNGSKTPTPLPISAPPLHAPHPTLASPRPHIFGAKAGRANQRSGPACCVCPPPPATPPPRFLCPFLLLDPPVPAWRGCCSGTFA